ncbi:sensor histidine kinase [Undibacterium sp.]|uniref:sensor histidine kinase n=1 Tax=Undibacterium sp. TaxID=1914977 RepID=UPI003752E884
MSNFLSSRLQKWRKAWSLKFYLRVYLAVLASLAVAAVILFVLMQVAMNGADSFKRNMENFSYVASSVIPPASSGKAAEIEAIKQWGFWLDMDITVFKLDGTLSSSTKQQALTHLPSNIRAGWYAVLPDKVAIQLKDQRWIIVDMSRRIYTPSVMQIIVAILVVLAIALGSYPLVRRLTKRLEHLQISVEALGEGKLGTRVAVEGNDEVARLAISFNHASARIEALMNAQKSLLANASHELRSPLTRISMATELMMDSAPEHLRKELKTNIQELDQLIDEILLSSRLEATKETTPEWDSIDLVGLLAEECVRVNAELKVELDHSHMQAVSALKAEGKLLRRLIRNLLENAQRYGDNKAIEVFLRAEASQFVIEVCDRGRGIPADQCDRVFEPFYRLPGSSETNGGVGLGLSLVKQIAERHSGSIRCLPRDGGGTCFRFDLPK